MLRIKRDDKVKILAGKDRGKVGKVLWVMAGGKKVIVEKLNMVKKTRRKTQQDQQGGFMEIEAPLHISNVALVDKKNKATRFTASILKDGNKVRICKVSGDAV